MPIKMVSSSKHGVSIIEIPSYSDKVIKRDNQWKCDIHPANPQARKPKPQIVVDALRKEDV